MSIITDYLILKAIHIFFAMVITGNSITYLWMRLEAVNCRSAEIYKYLVQLNRKRIIYILTPSMLLLFVTGTANILVNNYQAYHDYYVLFGTYALIAIILLMSIPIKLINRKILRKLDSNLDFINLHRVWCLLEGINIFILAISIYVMVVKNPI